MTVLFFFALVVILPATAGLFLATSPFFNRAARRLFAAGAPVVYCHEEVSTCPAAGPRDIRPAERGEYYYYTVVDYLRVAEVLGDGRIVTVANDQRRHCFWPNDSSLRKARLRERLICRLRFPQL